MQFKFGNGFLVGTLGGALWGFIGMLVLSVVFMLVSGVIALPAVGAATLAGAFGAALIAMFPVKQRSTGVQIASVGLMIALLGAFSAGQPLGVPLGMSGFWQIFILVLLLGSVWMANRLCLNGLEGKGLSRYQLEVLIIRLIKGFGFVVFTVMVALPFYIMVMTSLKSQQSLLGNPLDFSLDFSQGSDELFRSYIELFTQYNFGTFLINSAIVSVVTVLLTLAFAVPGAYAVARLRFPGREFLSNSILLIYIIVQKCFSTTSMEKRVYQDSIPMIESLSP